jgi:hypothetical protein
MNGQSYLSAADQFALSKFNRRTTTGTFLNDTMDRDDPIIIITGPAVVGAHRRTESQCLPTVAGVRPTSSSSSSGGLYYAGWPPNFPAWDRVGNVVGPGNLRAGTCSQRAVRAETPIDRSIDDKAKVLESLSLLRRQCLILLVVAALLGHPRSLQWVAFLWHHAVSVLGLVLSEPLEHGIPSIRHKANVLQPLPLLHRQDLVLGSLVGHPQANQLGIGAAPDSWFTR